MSLVEKLFVYGTLRPPKAGSSPVLSFNYPKIIPFLRAVEPAVLEGAVLYDLGSFPAAVPGEGRITGEILSLDAEAFDLLDPLEGHPDVYRRERVNVQTEAGEEEAWIYWAPEDLAGMGERLVSGDWLSKV